MTITQLISRLEMLRDEHGNLPVRVYDEIMNRSDIEDVVFMEYRSVGRTFKSEHILISA